jgi:hypothetical protein
MSREVEQISPALFDKIRSRFRGVHLGDENAKATTDPEKARYFNFNYSSASGDSHGNITISLIDSDSLKVYYSKNITKDLDDEQRADWFQFLRNLREFAKRNMLSFDIRDITKNNLEIQDIKQQSKADAAFDTDDFDAVQTESFKPRHARVVEYFSNWVNSITEGQNNQEIATLTDLMSKPLSVGLNGTTAIGSLHGIIDDDSLEDKLEKLAQDQGEDADARPLIKQWLMDNGQAELASSFDIDYTQSQTPATDPAAEAENVRQTQNPNTQMTGAGKTDEPVTNESVNWIRKLAGL